MGGMGGIVSMALRSIGQKPQDRHVLLVVHEESGVAVWDFRSVGPMNESHMGDAVYTI